MKILQPYWLASRPRIAPATTVVLHASAGKSALSSISWLRVVGLSYHYVIERDGTVYKCVPASRVAFHAGVSSGPDGGDVNRYSIGICLANRNDGEPYPMPQITACMALIGELARNVPTLEWLTTHYAITADPNGGYRKSDPKGFSHMQYVADGHLKLWKPAWLKSYALGVDR